MNGNPELFAYGQFYSTATQFIAVTNTPIALTYNSSSSLKTMTYSGSQIKAPYTGTYSITYSIQVGRLVGNTAVTCLAWFRVNGTDVPNSASYVTMPSTIDTFLMTCPILLFLNSGDVVEVVFGNNDAAGHVSAIAHPAQTTPYVAPLSPSILVDVFYMGHV